MSNNIKDIISQLNLTKEQEKPIIEIIQLFRKQNRIEEKEEFSIDFLRNLQELFKYNKENLDLSNNIALSVLQSQAKCDFDKLLLELQKYLTYTGLKYANDEHFKHSGYIFLTFVENNDILQKLCKSNHGGVVSIKVDCNSCLNQQLTTYKVK